jgi:hypothetical protein
MSRQKWWNNDYVGKTEDVIMCYLVMERDDVIMCCLITSGAG